MAGGTVLNDLHHQRVAVAVRRDRHHMLHIAARLALAPQLLPGTGPEAGALFPQCDVQTFGVHIRHGEHLFRVKILHDGGDQPLFVEFQLLCRHCCFLLFNNGKHTFSAALPNLSAPQGQQRPAARGSASAKNRSPGGPAESLSAAGTAAPRRISISLH